MLIKKTWFLIITLSLSGFFGASHLGYSQEYRATIMGEVVDPSGRLIPKATVTAIQKTTQQVYKTQTNSDGTYVLNYLLPGVYQLTAEASGFKRKVYSNVTLESAQKLNLMIRLAVGAQRQQVTVTASPGLLDTATASNGSVMNQAKVQNIPSTGRQVWQNVTFAQGVRGLNDPFQLTARNNSASYTVDGSPKYTNAFYVNGAPVSDQGSWTFSPNQDAVEEVKVASNAYDAQYGQAAGGSFNVTLKQGTNQFHGNLYEQFINSALSANYWQSNLHGLPNALDIFNTFGGVLGGPIRKNKTFFFGSYEGFRQHYQQPSPQNVPPQTWRVLPDGSVDFSQSGFTVYDPLTGHCVQQSSSGQCSQYARDAFPGDTIPADRINPTGKALLGLYPMPTAPGLTQNYLVQTPTMFSYDQYLGRVDQNFSEKTRLSAVFGLQRNGFYNPGNRFPNVASTASSNPGQDLLANLDVTHIFSPSLLIDLNLSFARYTTSSGGGPALQQNFTGSKISLTMPNVPTTTHVNLVPVINVSGFASLFNNTESGSVNNYSNLAVSFTQLKGRHILRYGGLYRDSQTGYSGIPGQPNGAFTFSGQWTRSNPLAGGTNQAESLADLLLGYPASGLVSWDAKPFFSYHTYGLYVQDDYKFRPNLTLNIGLRWDIYTSPTERYNQANAGFCFTCTNPYNSQINHTQYPNLSNPLTGKLLFAGVTAPRAPFDVQLSNIQPRFGLAWAIKPWLVFRAGYGNFYSYGNAGMTTLGYSQGTSYVNSLDGGVTPTSYFLSGTPFPDGAAPPAGPDMPQAASISYDSPSRRVTSTQHWSAGLQWGLPKRILFDMEYVGSHTHAIAVNQSWDVISQSLRGQCQADPAICDTRVPNPFYGVVPSEFAMGATPTLATWQLMRPWPIFPSVRQNDDPMGYQDYNALQVRLERKVRNLDFIFNYVYSNWMDSTGYLNNGNFRDPNLWHVPSGIDQRHYLATDVLWPLPFGKSELIGRNSSGWLGALISHWMVDSMITYGTGTPVGIPAADFYGPGCTSYQPQGGQTRAHWINNNVNCYHDLKEWEPRTSPLLMGSLRNPAVFYFNSAMQKQFQLPREGMSLEARIAAYNVLNHPLFGGPNTNYHQPSQLVPNVGWEGFGTLPLSQYNPPRIIALELRLMF